MKIETVKTDSIKLNPANPRTIKDEKFAQLVRSVRDFPEMLKIRPIVVNDKMEVLGGNMRLRACIEAGLTDVHIIKASELTDDQQREFIIKDNVGFGEWDWEALGNEWDSEELADWGLDVPGWSAISPDELTDGFALPEGDRAPFQQITFTLADEQAEAIKNAIAEIKGTEEYKYAETMGNENSNGNALYLIVKQWEGQRTYC